MENHYKRKFESVSKKRERTRFPWIKVMRTGEIVN